MIINTGSADGLDPDLNVGDILISTEVRYHDVDVTAFGFMKSGSYRQTRQHFRQTSN